MHRPCFSSFKNPMYVDWRASIKTIENYWSKVTDTHQNVSEINSWAYSGGAISVTEWNYGPPISKVQRPISDRLTFCVGSGWSPIRPVRCRRFFSVERGWRGLYKMVSNESLLFGGRREGEGDWFSGKYRFDLGPPIKCFSKLKNPHSPYPQWTLSNR